MIWKHDSNDSGTVHSHLPRSQFENILVYWRTGDSHLMEENGCLTQTDRFYHHTGRSNVIHVYKDDCRSKPEKVVQNWFKQIDIGARGAKVSSFDMKPEQLLQFLIRDYSETNGIVLDFCMNRGITGVAALNMKRRFIGVELSPSSYELAKARISEKFCIEMESRADSKDNQEICTAIALDSTPMTSKKRWNNMTTGKNLDLDLSRVRMCKKMRKIRADDDNDKIYDRLNILGKHIEIGTPKNVMMVYIKSVEPCIDKKCGRYTIVHSDGRKLTLTVNKNMVQKIL